MSDDDKRLLSPVPTPIPTTGLEMATIVARIDDRTKTMKEIDLPRIESIATEAKDRVIGLGGRVDVLESNPHDCDEKDRQLRQDGDIAENKEEVIEHREKIKTIFGWKGWVVGLSGLVIAAVFAFATTTRSTDAAHSANIENNTKGISRNADVIKDLPNKRDLEAIKTAVTGIPGQVAKTMDDGEPPTVSEVSEAAEELPLKTYELKQLRMILGRAEKREKNGKKLDLLPAHKTD